MVQHYPICLVLAVAPIIVAHVCIYVQCVFILEYLHVCTIFENHNLIKGQFLFLSAPPPPPPSSVNWLLSQGVNSSKILQKFKLIQHMYYAAN